MSMTLNSFSRPRTKSKNTQLHDLCTVFISAIEINNDNILNKKECIEKIIKLKRDRENLNKKKKFNIDDLLKKERPKIKNKVLQFLDEEKRNEEKENKKENEKKEEKKK
jgi:hypothetical protein